MIYTSIQKDLLNYCNRCLITFKKMFFDKRELGYTSKGENFTYKVVLAADAPSKEIQNIVLIHELGHIYLGHVNKDISQEISDIKNILKRNNKTVEDLCYRYSGFMNFINLCMDFEVNSKLLTLSNVLTINKYFKICLPGDFHIETKDSYRDYYEPLIKNIDHIDFDSSFKSSKNNYKDSEVPQDIPNRVPFNKISKELKDILKKENYKEGSSKEKESITVGESLVETYIEINSKNEGEGFSNNEIIFSKEENLTNIDPEIEIKKFLENIIEINNSYKRDPLKHYNRGTRNRENGILYSSIRRTHEFNSKKKLGIIVDVSSSMRVNNILKAISTLKNFHRNFNKDSSLITWNTFEVERFPLSEIPLNVKIGGDTNLVKAIRCISEEGFSDIVIYSDFEIPFNPFKNYCNKIKSKTNLYFIVSNNSKKASSLKSIFKEFPILVL